MVSDGNGDFIEVVDELNKNKQKKILIGKIDLRATKKIILNVMILDKTLNLE
ncbi:MAG: hypothetical protein HOF66_03585 [Nitrosomonadaceae bacterium]|nr:hypothetical protein [Nitrosomonadaceae bacterium]